MHTFLKFSGYFACPLKGVYLSTRQEAGAQWSVLEELQTVGDRAGFEAAAQVGDRLYSRQSDVDKKRIPHVGVIWGQDTRSVIRLKDGSDIILTLGSNSSRAGYAKVGKLFARALGLPVLQHPKLHLQGGNFFIGKNEEGEFILLIGEQEINNVIDKLRPFWQRATAGPKRGDEKREMQAREILGDTLNIDPANIHTMPQLDFHIDLVMRPLDYPYVLIQDFDLSLKLLHEELAETFDPGEREKLLDTIRRTKKQRKVFNGKHPSGALEKAVLDAGLVPIPAPLGFGNVQRTRMHYGNAIVHQKTDGELVYITNRSWNDGLNRRFERWLKQTCPQVDQVSFIQGKAKKSANLPYIEYALTLKGGVHCLSAEYPDFDAWRVAPIDARISR